MKVERNIKLPSQKRGKPAKYPWKELKVGDSFFVDGSEKIYSMYSCVASYNKKASKKIKISTRLEGTGVRVWRIK